MNLLNFFNTFGITALHRRRRRRARPTAAAPTTQAEFDRQWPKTVAAILGIDADVIGINEIENDGYGPTSAIQFLVDQLNAATAPGTYAFIDVDAEHRPGQRARHRRDQGRLALQAGQRHAGRHDGGAEHGRLRQRRRRRTAQPPVARAGLRGERHRRARSSSTSTTSRARAAPATRPTPATARATAPSCARTPRTLLAAWLAERPDRHRRPRRPDRRRPQLLREGGPDHGARGGGLHQPDHGRDRWRTRTPTSSTASGATSTTRSASTSLVAAGHGRRRVAHQRRRAGGARLQHRLQDRRAS